MQKKAMEDMLQVGAVQEELASVRAERDSLYDAKMKVEATVDEKDSQISQLQVEVQRGKEEVMCRKLIIDQMTKSMMDHEKESAEMADKLSSLKSQLMLVASEDGLREKFSCVKIGRVSDVAATVSFAFSC